MYFSDNPSDRYYERMMVGVPNFKPRGHGVVIVGSRPTEPLVILRIQDGTATHREILTETTKAINHRRFRHRLNKYLKESEMNPMRYKNEKHQSEFEEAIRKKDKKDYAMMAALYLLTADLRLWNLSKRHVGKISINFADIRLKNILLCTAFPISASAAGSIEGVDYDRIKGFASGDEVILTLGDMQFHGVLTNGSLNDEERDKIIRQAMNDMKITSGMLINAETLIDKAQNVQGFGTGDVINAAAKLAGVSDLLSIYNYFMGTGKDPEKIAKDIATSQVTDAAKEKLEDVLTEGGTLVMKGAGKFAFKLLFILPDLTEIGLDALAKYENIKYTVTLGTEKMVMLEAFYQACNERIKEKEGELGTWVIRFDNATATDTFSFWGISGLMSEWTLSGELKKGVTGAGDGVIGNYEGTLTLSMKALDMAETFDKNWVMNSNALPSGIMRVFKSGDTFTDTTQQTTKLERMISGEFNLYIAGASSGIYEPTVFGSFNGADIIDFSFNHKAESTQSAYTDGSNGYIYGANLTSSDVNTVYFEGYHTFPIIMGSAGTGPDTWVKNTGDLEMNVGTVWEALDGEVSVEINFGR